MRECGSACESCSVGIESDFVINESHCEERESESVSGNQNMVDGSQRKWICIQTVSVTRSRKIFDTLRVNQGGWFISQTWV
jgi:hypothetical protein